MRVTVFRLVGILHHCFLSFCINYIILFCFDAGTAWPFGLEKNDSYSIEDLLFDEIILTKRVFYDILEPQNHEFKQAIGIKINL